MRATNGSFVLNLPLLDSYGLDLNKNRLGILDTGHKFLEFLDSHGYKRDVLIEMKLYHSNFH